MGDEAAGQLPEGFVDVGPAFPADSQPPEAVQPGETSLYNPPVDAKSGAVPGVSAGDGWHDASGADLVTVDVVVVAAVGEQKIRLAPWVADTATDERDGIQQRQELGYIVAVAASENHCERSAVAVSDQVMSGAGPAPVDRRRARVDPPFLGP